MWIYLLLYICVIFALLFIFVKLYHSKNAKKTYQKFLLYWILAYIIWLIFYLLSFTTTYNKEILLIMSRMMYFISLLAMYMILFYIIYFNETKIKKLQIYFIYFCFFLFWIISIFSPLIISDLVFDKENIIYIEELWALFKFYYYAYLLYPIFFVYFAFLKIKNINKINKIRFKNFILWFFSFHLIQSLFLWILPNFWIWLMQKEQIVFFIPFVIALWYSNYKYYFVNIKIWFWKILLFIFCLFSSLSIVYLQRFYYLKYANNYVVNFWWVSEELWLADIILWIIIYLIFYKLLSKLFLSDSSIILFERNINKLKKYIPYIQNIIKLNNFLEIKFKHLFKIDYFEIKIFSKKDKNLELYKYFSQAISKDLFINDIVFIEENKYKIDLDLLKKQVDSRVYLVFPLINNKWQLLGIVEFWNRPFKDQYYIEEMKILKIFVDYLVWHLKYIEIYNEIKELNINLDKKVDEKTIEYNKLLNKQKEFISIASHEIKTPVTSSIFQIDCLLDDLDDWINEKNLKKELHILNDQLLKLWELVNKIFHVEEYDIKKIKLFKEKINLNEFFENEVKYFKKIHPKININLSLDKKIGFVDLDIIQFEQVIENLINNALKFSSDIIKINVFFNTEGLIIIKIEDNWIWFKNIEIEKIFEKYNKWNISSEWIWVWLYLCKRIIDMHGWKIQARNTKELWWACFEIRLPMSP